MNRTIPYFLTLCGLLVMVFSLSPGLAMAQRDNPYLQLSYQDSVVADNDEPFLRDNITITNTYQHTLRFTIHISLPQGYSLVSRNDVSLELAAGSTTILPVTLSKAKTAPASNQTSQISVALSTPDVQLSFPLTLRCKEIRALRIFQMKKTFQVSKDDRSLRLALKIKNIGNTGDQFFVRYTNKNLQIDKKIKLALEALSDTMIYYDYTIPAGFIHDMESENIVASVGNDTNFLSFTFVISKVRNNNKGHSSAYATFPLNIETGMFASNSELSYFWGISGALAFNDNNMLSFNYRSKQYGVLGIQHDMFNIFFRHRKWELSIGQMNDSRHFISNGLGMQFRYDKNEWEGLSLSLVTNKASANLYNKNQTATAITRYRLGKMFWTNLMVASEDPIAHTHNYIIDQKLTLIHRQNLRLDISGGIGLEQHLLSNNNKDLRGLSYGYDFVYTDARWELSSGLLINGNNYPGIYKGWRSINHNIGYRLSKRFTTGLFYSSSYTRQNYFIDSIYYDNRFIYNLTTYGVKASWMTRPFSLSLSAGEARTSGLQASNNTLPAAHSFTGSLLIPVTPQARFNFNTTVNFKSNFGLNNSTVLYYVHNGSFISRYGGINFYLTRMPRLSGNQDGSFLNGYRSSSSISPYINISFFRRKITGRIQYSFYKTTEGTRINETQSLLGNIAYSNPKKGLEIQLYGNYALKSTQELSSFISLSLNKSFNVPILTSRKYYDLNLVIFEDRNGNGRKDLGDTLMSDILVNINHDAFLSNGTGAVCYHNIERGNYTLDFHDMKNQKGLIPTQGFTQMITVNGQTSVDIPFTKGKVIKGDVSISLDSLSTNTFSVGQLKVIASDSIGNKFTTFTNDDGGFQLNLPSGSYIVSLNPEAYDEVFRPVQMAFNVDLLHNEEQPVHFHIRQKQRKINRVKAEL